MTPQLRRTAIIPRNVIAEACGRDLLADKRCALGSARATLVELGYLILLAHDLHLIEDELHDSLHAEVIQARHSLSGFIKAIANAVPTSSLLS